MFECRVYLHLPLTKYPDVSIAKYEFDPGLQIGDKVKVTNLEWQKIKSNEYYTKVFEEVSFSFEAMVTLRKYEIEPQNGEGSIFRILIGLEMADKEQLAKLAEIIEHNSTP